MKYFFHRINYRNLRRLLIMLTALAVTSIGICFFTLAGFGTDPFTCMNQGLTNVVGFSFGTTQLLVNLTLLVCIFFVGRYLIGISTLANMVLIGYFVDWFLPGMRALFPEQPGMPLRIMLMLAGVAAASLGTATYSKTKMGASPYDATGLILSQVTRVPYMWCRIFTDAITTTVGFLTGSIVGVGTVITALFMGPLITWFGIHFCDRILHMDEYEDPLLTNNMLHRTPEG